MSGIGLWDDIVTPEGQAFADYVESINANPYPYDTADHARYAAEMDELIERAKA